MVRPIFTYTCIFFSFAQQTSEKSDFGEKRTSREKAKERRHNTRARLHTHTQNVPRKAGEEKELFAREPSRFILLLIIERARLKAL